MLSLEKLLDGLEVNVEAFAVCRVGQDAALSLPALERPSIHYCLQGRGVIRGRGWSPVPFEKHAFIVLPAGAAIVVEPDDGRRRAQECRCQPLAEGLQCFQAGAGEPATVLACGRISAVYQNSLGLFDHLSEPLVDSFACQDGLCRPFEALLHELAAPRPGTRAMSSSLMRQCLVLLLRRTCADGQCRAAWIATLDDPRLGRAVAAMAEKPERDFSLAGLAEIAGMSRSSFAVHFAAAFGRSPIEMLKELRMKRAAQLLRSTDLPVKSVAYRVGYASRSYFSRAFKAAYGKDPAHYRSDPPSASGPH